MMCLFKINQWAAVRIQAAAVGLFRTICLIAGINLPGTTDRTDVQTSSGIPDPAVSSQQKRPPRDNLKHWVFVKMPIL